ncbi:HYR-like domain-containing protein [Brumimicrobium aurantiacum]|uniref:PKD domain-containing protein n=1 Tax=Brumimicrobium aurantiacum TaxID=1737063 RepID=A0A3E1EVR9_9FLAO|nr:gliding motility-associated C-terminal domain-containing protein [Brumimicrobium aurantiacum]RFC53655.1 hypothetical protein DXU93_11030 [Brumimicrobium aurantiacum]
MNRLILTTIVLFCIFFTGNTQNCPSYSTLTATGEACAGQTYTMHFANTSCPSEINFDYSGNINVGGSVLMESILTGNTIYSESSVGGHSASIGPIDPTLEGTAFKLSTTNATYTISQNGITTGQAISEEIYFNLKPIISSATLSITTPSGVVTRSVQYCKDFNVGLELENTDYCNTLNVALPWELRCDQTNTLLGSGNHNVTVYPSVPSNTNDLVDIVWNQTTCEWDVSANFDCDNSDIGNIFTISPDPTSGPTNTCVDGNETFTIEYLGVSGSPNCCSNAGPKVPVEFNTATSVGNTTVENSLFGGTNNAGYITIPPNNLGGSANALNLSVSINNYCFNAPNIDYLINIFVDGIVVVNSKHYNPIITLGYNLSNIPWYDQNSVVDIYVSPILLSNGGVNTTYSPNAVCGSLNPMEWTADITASLDVEFIDSIGTGLPCTNDTIIPHVNCTPDQPALVLASAADCNLPSTLEVTNYDNALSYTFVPTGPTINAAGIISGVAGNYSIEANNGSCSSSSNFTIDPGNPVPSYSVSSVNPTVCSGSDGYILLSGLDNSVTYSVTYDDNGTTVGPANFTSNTSGEIQITGLSAGSYDNFLVDLNGCSTSDLSNINLTDPSAPTVDAGLDQTICEGTSITLNATSTPPGAVFSWDNGVVDGMAFSPNSTSTYTVTADLNGCIGTDNVTITVTPQDTPTFTAIASFCENDAIPTLPTSSNENIAGTWSPAIVSNTPGTTTYTFTPDASECASVETMDILVYATPSPTINPVANQCLNASPVTLNASPAGGTFSGNGVVGNVFTPSVAGIGVHTIAYTYTDGNGCTGVGTIDIVVDFLLDFSLSSNSPTVCGGSDGEITISGLEMNTSHQVSYNKNGNLVGPLTLISNANGEITITGLSAGAYSDFIVDWISCSGSNNTTITLSDPNAPNITTPGDYTICEDSQITLTALNPDGATISWDNGVTDGVAFTPTTTTTYTVTGTLNNCIATDDVIVTVDMKVDPTFASVVDFCENETAPVLGSVSDNGITGTWNPSVVSNNVGNSTYTFTPINSACANEIDFNISVNPVPTPTIDSLADMCEQAVPVTLVGTPNGGVFSGAGVTGSTFDPTVAGSGVHTITYEYTDGNGCMGTATTNINVTTNILFTLSSTEPTTCNGTDGTITIGGLDAGEMYDVSYLFNNSNIVGPITITANGAGNAVITGLGEGSYTDFDVVYKTCSGINNSTIVLNDPPLPTINAGLDQVVCQGQTTILSAHNPDGATISWSNGITDNMSFTPPQGITTYTVTGSLNACISTDQVTVTVPTPIISMTSPGNLTANCDISEQPVYADFDAFLNAGGTINLPVDGLVDSASFTLISENSDGNTCPEIVTRVYEITDVCGNSVSTSQSITIHDLVDPTGTAPADLSLQCIGDLPTADPLLVTDEADNCTVNPIVSFISEVSDGNTCPEVITRTYRVTDDCGNSIDLVQTITINDDTPPTGDAPSDIAVQCIGDVPAQDINLVTNVSDNCTVTPTVTFISDVSDGNTCPEIITRTYNIADDCGNNVDLVQIITVGDNIAPTANTPDTLKVDCLTDVPAADVTVISGVSDNCTSSPMVAFVSDVSDGNTCAGELITRTYSVTDDCGNVTSIEHMILIENYDPNFNIVGNDPTTCGGVDGSISLTGLNPSTDYWLTYDGGTSNLITTDVNGAYEITGLTEGSYTDFTLDETSCNVCSTTENVTITLNDPLPPTIDAGPDLVACDDEVITINAINPDNANLSWNNGVTDGVGFVSPLGTTKYIVTAELANCFAKDSLEVMVNPLPNVSAGNDIQICDGDQVTLTATGNAVNYTWNNGVVDGIAFTPTLGITNYIVTATSVDGCENKDTVEVEVMVSPDVSFAANRTVGCAPDEINILNTTPGSIQECKYTIDGGHQYYDCNIAPTFLNAGCYDINLEVELTNGCVDDLTMVDYICMDDYPVANFTVEPEELSNIYNEAEFTNKSTGAFSYEWNFGDGEFSNATDPTHTYMVESINEEYTFIVDLIAISNLGCRDTFSLDLPFYEELIYFVPNTFTPDGNKSNETFKPIFTTGFDPQNYNFKVYNRWGDIVFESNDANYGWDGTYKASNYEVMPSGTYVYRINFNKLRNDEEVEIMGTVNLLR